MRAVCKVKSTSLRLKNEKESLRKRQQRSRPGRNPLTGKMDKEDTLTDPAKHK